MNVPLSNPINANGGMIAAIALRSPGRDFIDAMNARRDATGGLPDDAIRIGASRLSGIPASTLKRLSSIDLLAIRNAVEGLLDREGKRQALRKTLAQDSRRRAREHELEGEE